MSFFFYKVMKVAGISKRHQGYCIVAVLYGKTPSRILYLCCMVKDRDLSILLEKEHQEQEKAWHH